MKLSLCSDALVMPRSSVLPRAGLGFLLFAGSLLVVALALLTEYGLGALQRVVTPKGLRVGQTGVATRRRLGRRSDPGDLVAIP